MTVKELKEQLANYPDDMDVFLAEFEVGCLYAPADSVVSREINFLDEDDSEVVSTQQVVIIDVA